MKVVGSTETLGLLKTLYIYFYTILTRVTFLFLNIKQVTLLSNVSTVSLKYWGQYSSPYITYWGQYSSPYITYLPEFHSGQTCIHMVYLSRLQNGQDESPDVDLH